MDKPNLPETQEHTLQIAAQTKACEGHFEPPYACSEYAQRHTEGYPVPCLKMALTLEALL